jgi:Skp family chaperone for outer membrane proteins
MSKRVGRWCRAAIFATAVNGILAGSSARSGEPSPAEDQTHLASRASGIALIDIGEVYKNSRNFQRDMEELKLYRNAHGPAIRDGYKRNQQQMDEILVELAKHEKDSIEYERLSTEWKKLYDQSYFASISQAPKDNKVEFMRREARIYYDSYQDICEAIREYTEANGIHLVLRCRRTPVELGKATSLMRRVNRGVVFHNVPDITDEIIRRLNQRDEKPGF